MTRAFRYANVFGVLALKVFLCAVRDLLSKFLFVKSLFAEFHVVCSKLSEMLLFIVIALLSVQSSVAFPARCSLSTSRAVDGRREVALRCVFVRCGICA